MYVQHTLPRNRSTLELASFIMEGTVHLNHIGMDVRYVSTSSFIYVDTP
jgi:hypothetical protein